MNDTQKETILNAPGLVGKIADYINETSYKYQPILAMSGAIVATGAIYGQRLRTQGDLRTNVYIFSLADSGAGKDGPRKSIKKLFDALPEEFSKIVCGNPASAPGLLSALNRTGGVGLFLIDEVGHYLSGINARNAQSHAKDIMPLLTQLFTHANTTYKGLEYSDRTKGMESKKDIIQPCACVLGSSVPERVSGAITYDDIADGFLPRWLVFESTDIAPPNNPNLKNFEDSSGPALVTTIIEYAKAIDNLNFIPGMLALIVPKAPDADEMLKDFENMADARRIKASENQSNMKYIHTRAYEYVEKLSLIACEFENNKFVITRRSVEWAIAVVEYSMEKMRVIIENVAASPYEQAMSDMLRIISRHGELRKTDFCNNCRRWGLKKREDLLNDLVACGLVMSEVRDKTTYIKAVKCKNVANV
jgi:hypothetical protein